MYNIKIKYTQTEENIMLDIKIEKVKTPKVKPDYSALGFGKYFTDHMFLMNYSEDKGWHDARIVPYGPIPLDPSTMVFHYAQELFEGLKAYRTSDGNVQLFRPQCNVERMNNTCKRLCVPTIDPDDALQAIETIVEVDKDWVPYERYIALHPSVHHRYRPAPRSTSVKDLHLLHNPLSRRLILCCRNQPR